MAVLAAGAAVACAHAGPELLSSADASFHERSFGAAIREYREVSDSQCLTGDPRLCCAALIGEADSLSALNEREQAVHAWRRARAECPEDLTVRRKLFLAEHPTEPGDAEAPERLLSFPMDVSLGRLAADVTISWVAVFLDGEPVGRERMRASPGAHDLEAEVWVELKTRHERPRRYRLRDARPLAVPAVGAGELVVPLRLIITERVAAETRDARGRFELQVGAVTAAGDVAPPPPPTPGSVEEYAAKHAGFALFESGHTPRLPRAVVRRGAGWGTRLEICVAPDGAVERIKFPDAAPVREPAVDAAIIEAVRRWRYGSFKVDGRPRGFCHTHDLDLRRR